MSETRILIRLLRTYIPRNWEFVPALSKLQNFREGGVWFEPLLPSVRYCKSPHHFFNSATGQQTSTFCFPICSLPFHWNFFLHFLSEFVVGVCCLTSLLHAQPSVIFQHTHTFTRPDSIPSVPPFAVPHSPDDCNKYWSKYSPKSSHRHATVIHAYIPHVIFFSSNCIPNNNHHFIVSLNKLHTNHCTIAAVKQHQN
jgi:hypothetical protein